MMLSLLSLRSSLLRPRPLSSVAATTAELGRRLHGENASSISSWLARSKSTASDAVATVVDMRLSLSAGFAFLERRIYVCSSAYHDLLIS